MAVRSKFFKAATAGKTADGRVIKDQWLIDIHETYDRKEREASVFLNHDSVFGNFGDVATTRLSKDKKGRNTLWLQVEPTPGLMKLNKSNQYKYPSIGVIEDFAGTGKAYLGHLGAVQDPASVGINPINFSHSDGSETQVICFACEDAVTFELEQTTDSNDIPTWFRNLFKKNTQDSDMDTQLLKDMKKIMAEFRTDLNAIINNDDGENSALDTSDYATELKEVKDQMNEFKERLDKVAPDNDDKNTKFSSLESKFESLSNKVDAALKENDDKPTPPHSGDGDNFSMDSIV